MAERQRYFRRVISIPASCSPNIRLAQLEQKLGLPISHKEVVPGVVSYREYLHRKATWDKIRQHVGLHAMFWEGVDVLLFPPDWLDHSEKLAVRYRRYRRRARAMGIDPAEGGDDTSFAIIDEFGLMSLRSLKTPDTNDIFKFTVGFIREFNIPPDCVVFDRGGGGQQQADRLRAQGYAVRSVGFGEAPVDQPSHKKKSVKDKTEEQANRYAYRNLRAQIFWELSQRMDPQGEHGGFAIPGEYSELRRQLSPFPRRYDDEGRIYLPPKHKKPGAKKTESLADMIGRSPDDADALALALYGLTHRIPTPVAGMVSI